MENEKEAFRFRLDKEKNWCLEKCKVGMKIWEENLEAENEMES